MTETYTNPFLDSIMGVDMAGKINKTTKPLYSISADDIFSSDIQGWDKQSVCYGWVRHETRSGQGYGNAKLISSGPVSAFNIIVMVDANGPAATIQQRMHSGGVIGSIAISRYNNMAEPLVPMQTTEYKNCKIQSYRQEGDKIVFAFSFASVTDTFFQFDEATGKKMGQQAANVDFEKWTVK